MPDLTITDSQPSPSLSIAKSEPLPSHGGFLSSMGDYARGVWDNLKQTGQGMVNLAEHPVDSIKAMGAAQDALRVKAADAAKKGDYVTAARHAIDYLIPLVGPAIDAMGDEAQQGQVAHSLGQATALGLQMAGPGALSNPGAIEAAARIGSAAKAGVKGGVQAVATPKSAGLAGLEYLGRQAGVPGVGLTIAGVRAGAGALKGAAADWARTGAAAAPAAAPETAAAAAAAPAAEDTALLDQIAQGMAGRPFAKLPPPAQETVRTLAARMNQAPAPQPVSPVPAPAPAAPAPQPAPTPAAAPGPATPPPPPVPAAIPETHVLGGGAPLRPPYGPRPTAPEPAPAPTPANAAAPTPTPEEMAAVFRSEPPAANGTSAGEAKHMAARNNWADEMARRLFADGQGVTPQDAQSLTPLGKDGVYQVDPQLDALARAKSASRGPLPSASKMSADTILRMHQKLWDLWNESLPAGRPPVGSPGLATAQ